MQAKYAMIVSLCIIVNAASLKAQQAKYHALKIGDTMPDIELNPVVNYSKSHVKISDFRGKVLLLDFWSVWCAGCIAAFPKLEALQSQYKSQLTVMPVSFTHTAAEIKAFYKRQQTQGRKISLPSAVYQDTINEMTALFPLVWFPLEIWIDQAGVVRHISEAFLVTPENMKRFINHQEFNLPTPHLQEDFDVDKPFLQNNNGGPDSAFIYRSLITHYIDSVSGNFGFSRQQTEKGIKLFYPNASVVDLIRAAVFGKEESANYKRVMIESADSGHLMYPAFDTNYYINMKSNAYCYELILPPGYTMQEAFDMMYRDVCSFFKVTSAMKKRYVLVRVLTRLPSFDSTKLLSSDTASFSKQSDDELTLTLVNSPVSEILSFIEGVQTPNTIDETNLQMPVSLRLIRDEKYSLAVLNNSLRQYGLVLREQSRQLQMLVIRKN